MGLNIFFSLVLLCVLVQAIPFKFPQSDVGSNRRFIPQNCNPDISINFNLTAGGTYSGVGNITYAALYPFEINYPPSPVTILVNPSAQILCLISPVLGTQCVTSTAYYFALPANQGGFCFINPDYNFSTFIATYQQAVNNEVCPVQSGSQCLGKIDVFTGLVQDGSSCGNYVAVTLKTGFNSIIGNNPQLRGYTIIQTLYNPEINSVIKIIQDLQFYTITPNDPAANNISIPASCSSPISYCSTYYPPGFNYTLNF